MVKATNPVKSLRTTAEIIGALDTVHKAGVSEIANRIERPPSIVHNHLDTLQELEYVIQNGQKYELSLKFLQHGGNAQRRNPLFQVAKSEVNKLASETEELITLLVEEHGRGVYLDVQEGDRTINYPASAGNRILLHCSAAGKAVLAHMDIGRVKSIIERHGLPPQTDNSITDRDELFDTLKDVRRNGVAYDQEEFRDGLKGIGAPIQKIDGSVIGSLSVAGPTHRMPDKRLDGEIQDLLMESINVIELNINRPNIQ